MSIFSLRSFQQVEIITVLITASYEPEKKTATKMADHLRKK